MGLGFLGGKTLITCKIYDLVDMVICVTYPVSGGVSMSWSYRRVRVVTHEGGVLVDTLGMYEVYFDTYGMPWAYSDVSLVQEDGFMDRAADALDREMDGLVEGLSKPILEYPRDFVNQPNFDDGD